MTNLNATASYRPETACNSPAPGVVARIFAVLEHLVRVCRSRRDAEYLATLNDYLLKDIGITRSDIEEVVRRGRFPI